jgi:hypothetical protein
MSGTAVDGVSMVGTVNVNIDYANMPATYQQVNYIVNVPANWVDTEAPLAAIHFQDLDGTSAGISAVFQGSTFSVKYGYTSDNGVTSSAGGSYDNQYVDIQPYIDGLDQYRGSTGDVGFSAGTTLGGNTGPHIRFKFGKVGYQVDWVVV